MTDTPAQHRRNQSKFERKPSEIRKRVQRNRARAIMVKKGLAHKGDGKDVDHKQGVSAGNGAKNLRVISQHQNRAYPRTSQHKQIRGK